MSNSTVAELCIQNAYIPGRGLSDISIDQGKIISFSEPGETQAYNEVHDLKGWLLVPAMAEPHAHLDKDLTAEINHSRINDRNGFQVMIKKASIFDLELSESKI